MSWKNGRTAGRLPEVLVMLLFAFLAVPGVSLSQSDLRGRLILDYSRTSFDEFSNRSFNQDLQLSVEDDLFVKNLLTITYFLERFTMSRQPDDFIRQRWRGNLVGRYYTFSTELTPRYRLTGATGPGAHEAARRQFNLVVTPPKVPSVGVSYDWDRRVGGSGESRVDAVNTDGFVNTGYAYKFSRYRAVYRERKTDNRITGQVDRRIRDYNGGVGINTSLGRRVNLTADYDYLFTIDEGDPNFEGESVLNNLGARASARPVNWLNAYTSFLGNFIRREDGIDQQSSLSEVIAGLSITPTDYLQFSGSRDYRLLKEDGDETISDFARAEAMIYGRIRERMEGRAVVNRTFVIVSRQGSFPSQAYLFSLDTEVYPGVSLNSDFNISQSENPDQAAERFQLRRVVDLRAILTGRLMLEFNVRTLSFGEGIPWLETQVLDYGAEVNYQPAPRLTAILTLSRRQDRRISDQRDFLFNGSVNYVFSGGSSLNLIYNRRGIDRATDGAVSAETTSFSSADEGILVQFTLKFRKRANLRLSFDTRRVSGGTRIKNLSANFVKWF